MNDETLPGPPDSSQYATHLRLIQFTVLITSAALVITVLQAPTGKIARAHADVRRILELSETWTSREIISWLNERVVAPETTNLWAPRPGGAFELTARSTFYEDRVRSRFPGLAQATEQPELDPLFSSDPQRFVTLSDFRRLWDLGESITGFRVLELLDHRSAKTIVWEFETQKQTPLESPEEIGRAHV